MKIQPPPFSRRTLTGLAVLCVLSAPVASLHAQAPAQQLSYELPAGPLDRSLNAFARRAAIMLSFDPALTHDRQAPGLHGRYSVTEGFAALLSGSGLQAVLKEDGGYALVAAAPVSGALPQVTVAGAKENPVAPLAGMIAKRASSAMKTDTPLLETPQSVSVATADQMEATKAASLAEALDYTPGVISQASSFNRMVDDVRVRGFNLANANTGMLRDGMKYQPSVYDSSQEPYGLERLEVLRGAASVLYGQLSPGGVINAVSKRPMAEPYHEITADVGNNSRKQLTGDFSGPLSDDGVWSYRLTALVREANTQINYIDDDKTYLAPAITWRPSGRTALTLLGSYQHMRTRFVAPATAALTLGGTIPRSFFIGEPGYDRYDSEVYSAGYLFEHELSDQVKLRHNLRYFNADAVFNYLSYGTLNTGSGLFSRGVVNRREQSEGLTADTSLEFNFGSDAVRHKVLAGIDYFDSTYDSKRYAGAVAGINMNNPVYGATPVISTVNNGSRTQTKQYGLYVQDQIKLAGKLVWLIGGRQDAVDSTVTAYSNGRRTAAHDSAFTGRTGLVYLADNGLAPYLSFGQSFAPVAGTDRGGNTFKPTKSDQYEAGLRYQPQGSNTLLSAALYQITQTNGLTVDPVDATYSVQTGELRSRGLELEARTAFGRLEVIANYAYTDARTTKSNTPSEIGQRVSGVPYHTASTWAQYDFGGAGLPGLKAGLGVRYQGDAPVSGLNYSIPGHTLVDAMLAYDLAQFSGSLRGMQLKVNAKNLLNRAYVQCVASNGCRYGEERSVVATVSYRW
ncbi:TonB-dependent siderophore receptor [Herbaspirillum sp. WKF16]|jgi:iron complex outermembrane receptor protein|uniref:TonB-dependent siderophore receptor n=1 Tax=Herbaspirillum sp. WKF16 TaxID=3028312 RepID=UPI0023A932D9|nr:TonB-dependent siderophore receptor [Herbaspirillum sp. WKF16]WDZ95667.1 TonB-dependent siderophore receptor [Herbaspirillum sp. WKF16]